MKNFLEPSYWFSMSPEGFHISGYYFFGILCLLFLVAIVVTKMLRSKQLGPYYKINDRVSTLAWTNLIIGLLIWFMEYEEVYIFSARIWIVFWFISILIWVFFISKAARAIPAKLAEIKKAQEYRKYIP